MTSTQRVIDLAERLLSATRDQTAKWEAQESGRFVLQLPSGSVILGSKDNDGLAPYYMTIRDAKDQYLDGVSEREGDLPLLAELYDLARRQALRIDDVIDGIIRELGNPEPSKPDKGKALNPDEIPF